MVVRGPMPGRLDPDIVLRLWILFMVTILMVFVISALLFRKIAPGWPTDLIDRYVNTISQIVPVKRYDIPPPGWPTDLIDRFMNTNSRVVPVKRYDISPPVFLRVNDVDPTTECVDWAGKDDESYKVYLADRPDMDNLQLLTPRPRGNRFCIDKAASPRLIHRWLAVSAVDAQGHEGVLSKPVRVTFPG
jgi:hypothetical protein